MYKSIEECNLNVLDNHIGEEITYKQLCTILDIKYNAGGNAKIKQLNYIQCYYELEKNKTKYKIVQKYEIPLEYEDNRKSIYYDDLESIILFVLDSTDSKCVNWSISRALKLTAMVNSNYSIGRIDLTNTSKALEVDKEGIDNFYLMTYGKLRAIFENVLKSMKRKCLIDFSIDTMVCKKETNIQYNELREPTLDEHGNILYTVDKIYREATIEEQEKILEIGRETLLEMGCTSTQDCFIHRKWNKYKNMMNEKLRERCNIEFSDNGYTIVKNTKGINKEVSNILEHKDNLNKLIINALSTSTNKLLPEDAENRDILVNGLINIHTTLDLKNIIKNILKLEQEEERDILPF